MASLVLNGNTSGSVTISSPAVSGTTTLTLPVQTGTVMVNGPAFSAYANAATSLTNGAFTKISFQVEDYDTNNNFASSRFTPTVAGYYQISAASHIGLSELNYAMARIIQEARKAEALVEKARIVLRPVAVGDSGFTVTANTDGSFTVIGDKPVRWVKQTDFGNAEAIGYLADRLATLGVEKELFKKGAKAKDEVRIGEGDNAVIFDWEPSIEAGAELLAGPRGGDLRLESPWAGRYIEDLVDDQLSEDEIAMQWEYNTENPKDPRVVVEAISEEK